MTSLTPSAPYRVERVETEADLQGLREAWIDLAAAAPAAFVFQTWEWISTWWCHRQYDPDLWLLIALDGQDRLVGVVPWMLTRRRWGPFRLRRISFIGDNINGLIHQDLLARDSDREALGAAFVEFLYTHRGRWDVLDLEALAKDSPLVAPCARAPGYRATREAILAPYARLPGSWQTYEENTLASTRRKELRYKRRRLERDHPGQVRYLRVVDRDEIEPALEAMVRLTHERFEDQGLRSAFDRAAFVAFNRDMAALALERGWLRFYLLQVGEEVAAAHYSFLYRGRLHAWRIGMSVAWRDYSPGLLMMAHLVEQAIAEEASELDLLRGTHAYKLEWTDRLHEHLHLVLAQGAVGRLWILSGLLFDRAVALARRTVPQSLRDRANRWLAKA